MRISSLLNGDMEGYVSRTSSFREIRQYFDGGFDPLRYLNPYYTFHEIDRFSIKPNVKMHSILPFIEKAYFL